MKRTIFSSFVFLYPLNKAYQYRDVFTMNWSAIGLALSVCNHAHSWHPDSVRRNLFKWIDIVYMHAFTARTLYNSLTSATCAAESIVVSALMNELYYNTLGNDNFEQYTEKQKILHVFFHIFAVVSLTLLHQQCYWDKKYMP